MGRKRLIAGFTFVVAAIGIGLAGSLASACTILPAGTLNQAYGPPGKAVLFTGSTWDASLGPVQLRWNALNGPVLAQVAPEATGMIPPTQLTVPANAEAGFHTIVATQGQGTANAVRFPFQVTASKGAFAPPPQVLLPGGSAAPAPSNVGVGMIALLASLGLAGLLLLGAGTASLLRSYRRLPVAVNGKRNR